MKTESKILISGAGVSGLACALRLNRAGFKPVVVEKAPTIRAGGFLVSISDSALRFADELELTPLLRRYKISITASSYHDQSGKSILALNYSKMMDGTIDIVQIMRDDFVRVLYERAHDNIEFRFGDNITAIDQDGIGTDVAFASGKEEHFDAVVGCDGLHSSVRGTVFGRDEFTKYYLGLCCAAFRLPNVLEINSKFETHMEKNRYMAIFTTRDQDLGAVFVWATEQRETPHRNERVQVLGEAFSESTPVIRQVLECCPTDGSFYMDVCCQVEMPTWHKDSTVLVGDAAHSMTLFSGRGAAAAFSGAGRLSKAMIEQDTADAFMSYEAATMPIVSTIQSETRKAVKWYVPRNTMNYMLRDFVMRSAPNFIFRNYFRTKYSQV